MRRRDCGMIEFVLLLLMDLGCWVWDIRNSGSGEAQQREERVGVGGTIKNKERGEEGEAGGKGELIDEKKLNCCL